MHGSPQKVKDVKGRRHVSSLRIVGVGVIWIVCIRGGGGILARK
jgi:hypothetical protein